MFFKRHLPLILTGVLGVTFILIFFSSHPNVSKFQEWSNDWLIIIEAIGLFLLGVISVLQVHINKIRRAVPGWGYSAVLIFSFLFCTVVGLIWGYEKTETTNPPLNWIFTSIFIPLDSTMFSLLGFYMASAAYRGFRARSVEALLLLMAGLIILFGQVPLLISEAYVSLSGNIAIWVLKVLNMAARRAIIFGVALAGVAFSLRIILGIDKVIFGGTKD